MHDTSTRSPGERVFPPVPTSSTVPTASWPKMRPAVTSGTSPFKIVQIGAADGGRVDTHDDVCVHLDLRVGHRLPGFLSRSVIDERFHWGPPLRVSVCLCSACAAASRWG